MDANPVAGPAADSAACRQSAGADAAAACLEGVAGLVDVLRLAGPADPVSRRLADPVSRRPAGLDGLVVRLRVCRDDPAFRLQGGSGDPAARRLGDRDGSAVSMVAGWVFPC